MNLIEFTESLARGIQVMAATLVEVIKLINPANIDGVFKNLNIHSPGLLRAYLMVISIPLLLGSFFFLFQFQTHPYSLDNSVKVAFRYYVIAVLLPMSLAYVLYLFDTRLLKRKVTYSEALTLFTYALSPAIISGVFRTLPETWVLHLLIIMYSIYLVYAGMSARFGEEHITMPFLFLILTGIITSMIVYEILTIALMIPAGYY
jgi:hypothetical protein